MMRLEVEGLDCGYGPLQVLWDVNLAVEEGEIVAIVGGNGAGKTTLLKAICGEPRPIRGSVRVDGRDVARWPVYRVAKSGVAHVPEGRRVYPGMTVEENLTLGAFRSPAHLVKARMEEMFRLFPLLRDRRKQLAGNMSGGEQQMVAISRGLMMKPRVLLLDEPSLGLDPKNTKLVFEVIDANLRSAGLAIVIVEQKINEVLELADRACVLTEGRLSASVPAQDLLHAQSVRSAYLGASGIPMGQAATAEP